MSFVSKKYLYLRETSTDPEHLSGRLPYDSIKVTSTRKDFWHRYVTSPLAADLIPEDVIRGILQCFLKRIRQVLPKHGV